MPWYVSLELTQHSNIYIYYSAYILIIYLYLFKLIYWVIALLARLFEEYESYSTHPGVCVGVGVRVAPSLMCCMQVDHSSVTIRCIAFKSSTMLPNNKNQVIFSPAFYASYGPFFTF